jgi:hypothetical protein
MLPAHFEMHMDRRGCARGAALARKWCAHRAAVARVSARRACKG